MLARLMCLFVLVVPAVAEDFPTTDDEYALRKVLSTRVDSIRRHMRPTQGALNKSVPLWHGISLVEVTNFDEPNRAFSFHTYTQIKWRNQLMTWDPADYKGLSEIFITTDNLWNPDITLYNSATVGVQESSVRKLLSSNGDILWVPDSYYKVPCTPPRSVGEEWMCRLRFGSWVYNVVQLELQLFSEEGINFNDYRMNSDWEVTKSEVSLSERYYVCCLEPYAMVNYDIYLKRMQ